MSERYDDVIHANYVMVTFSYANSAETVFYIYYCFTTFYNKLRLNISKEPTEDFLPSYKYFILRPHVLLLLSYYYTFIIILSIYFVSLFCFYYRNMKDFYFNLLSN